MNLKVDTCLIVFAKHPIPNQVKTRLIPAVSPEQAASLYSAFLIDWCETLSELSNVDVVIAYTPAESQSELQTLLGEDVAYIPQVGIDLGERLTSASEWGFENRYNKIILVGSDSPTLPISYVFQAVVALDTRDVVIGPSVDGGYYLIGFSTKNHTTTVSSVFEDIAWSTANVFQQTVERIHAIDATLKLLPPWYDVDTPDDLAFLRAHLSAMRLSENSVQAIRTESLLLELLKENE